MIDTDKFKPIPLNPTAHAAKKSATDPEFKAAYDALEDEYAALSALLNARKKTGPR